MSEAMLNRVIRLQRRVREAPDDIVGWCELAQARMDMGERAEATADAARAVELAADAPEMWLVVGGCWRALADLERAREAYKAACAHDPMSPEPHLELGRTVLAEGRPDVAATVLATAVWLAPDAADIRITMGQALLALESFDQAEEHLREAHRLEPNDPEPWLALADLFSKRRESSAVLDALKRAYTADQHQPRIGLRFARALQEQGRNEAAYTVLEGLLSRHPSDPEVLIEMGRIEMALARLDAAASTFRRAARLDEPNAGHAQMYLGIALMKLHREADAVDALRSARQLLPSDTDVAYHLGEALYAVDELGEALSVVAQAALQARGDARLQDLLNRLCADEDTTDASGSVDMAPERALASVTSRSSEMAFTGDLAQFNLIDLLEFLRLNRRTGYLRVVSSKGVGEIMLVEGRLVGASTTNINRLGDLLIAQGSLSQVSLDAAIEAQRLSRDRTPLGCLLVEQGRLSTDALRGALQTQVQQTIADVLSWGDGQFAFEADESVRQTVAHPDLELDTGSIMLEVLRLMDEGEPI